MSYVGPVSSSIRILPRGSGIPIPCGWACVSKNDIEGLVIPEDNDAAMLRIAVHMASSGKYFDEIGDMSPSTFSDTWGIESSVSFGKMQFLNSEWLMKEISLPGDLGLCMSSEKFRPMVVSGNLSWGTKAVFTGYIDAFSKMGIDFRVFEYDKLMNMFSQDIVRKILISEVCDVDNAITHMIVIDGTSIPKNIPMTARKCGISTVLVTTEDPHFSHVTHPFHSVYDFVFSNDRNMAEMFGVHYLPTAADPRCVEMDKVVDVSFIGAIYPNRCRVLEEIAEKCIESGISIRVVGPVYRCSPSGVLADILEEGVVSTEECLRLQAESRVCINIFRDGGEDTGVNSMGVPPYSVNPRCYDVPMCGSILLTDMREEVIELFGKECVYDDDLFEKISDFIKKYNDKKDIADFHRKIVKEGHLYLHRASCMLCAIGQGFLSE
jgi:spore maturation protein CgeB